MKLLFEGKVGKGLGKNEDMKMFCSVPDTSGGDGNPVAAHNLQ